MNERFQMKRQLSEDEILNIFCDVCHAVGKLHNQRYAWIHRDLKVQSFGKKKLKISGQLYPLCRWRIFLSIKMDGVFSVILVVPLAEFSIQPNIPLQKLKRIWRSMSKFFRTFSIFWIVNNVSFPDILLLRTGLLRWLIYMELRNL